MRGLQKILKNTKENLIEDKESLQKTKMDLKKTNNWIAASLVRSQGKARKITRNIQAKHQKTITKHVTNPLPNQ